MPKSKMMTIVTWHEELQVTRANEQLEQVTQFDLDSRNVSFSAFYRLLTFAA